MDATWKTIRQVRLELSKICLHFAHVNTNFHGILKGRNACKRDYLKKNNI